MTRILLAIAVLLVVPLNLSSAQPRERAGQAAPPSLRQSVERFSGTTRYRSRDRQGLAQVDEVNIGIHNLIINGGQKLTELPFPTQGFLLIQLRGGRLTTIINGRRQERREDEYWTVSPGQRMGIETGDDSAVIQVVVIGSR